MLAQQLKQERSAMLMGAIGSVPSARWVVGKEKACMAHTIPLTANK